MMPKVSVRPAASRNISRPSCRPFSIWISRYSTSRLFLKRNGSAMPRSRQPSGSQASLHRALLVVRILGVLHGGGDGLHRHHAVGVLHRFLDVEVLDREVVGVVLEVAAQRLEV